MLLEKLPKLSYVLLTHNRAEYVRQAMESAFAQDYAGELEYIISDDCSTDRTYDIIRQCADSYQGGRRVVVTQTPQNLHLAGNTNHAIRFATGEWIIRADDDDLSRVDRCSQIGHAIAAHPGCSFVLAKQRRFTDSEEAEAQDFCRTAEAMAPASVYDIRKGEDGYSPFFRPDSSNKAWSARVYSEFPPLPPDAKYVDDLICMYRANALGYGVSIPAVTVMARDGSGNMCRGNDTGGRGYADVVRLERFNDCYFNSTWQPLCDTLSQVEHVLKGHCSPEEWEKAQSFLHMIRKDLDLRADLRTYWRRGTIHRFRLARKYHFKGIYNLLRCLPLPVFAAVVSFIRKWKK